MLSIFTLSLYKSKVMICTSLRPACYFRRYRHKVKVGVFIRITLGILDNLIWEKTQKSYLSLSEPRPYKKHKKRREYIQQKGRRTIYMALFTFTSVVQILELCWQKSRE